MQRFEYFTDHDVQKIHEATLHVLETVGVDFGYAPAVEVFKKSRLQSGKGSGSSCLPRW